jgi:hypothetical protein
MRLTRTQVEGIVAHARKPPYGGDRGSTPAAAEALDLPLASFKVLVSNYRSGKVPNYWRPFLPSDEP